MATIVMESAKVIEAAEKTIARIRARQIERDEKAIARRMANKAFSFRRGFYFMTRDEAIHWLDCSNSWGWRSMAGWGHLEHAEKLLRLARLGDPITLNEKDAEVLF